MGIRAKRSSSQGDVIGTAFIARGQGSRGVDVGRVTITAFYGDAVPEAVIDWFKYEFPDCLVSG